MKRIGVFCGSSVGNDESYISAALELAAVMAARDMELVYGAGNIGLMGILADQVLELGGKATGVIPDFLVRKEVVHTGLTELIIVETMHERKARMAELSDALVVMPGGFGTLDELFEVLTWNQLSLLQKPIGILNVNGYFDALTAMLDRMNQDRFVKDEHHAMVLLDTVPGKLIDKLAGYEFPKVDGKWIEDLKRTSRY